MALKTYNRAMNTNIMSTEREGGLIGKRVRSRLAKLRQREGLLRSLSLSDTNRRLSDRIAQRISSRQGIANRPFLRVLQGVDKTQIAAQLFGTIVGSLASIMATQIYLIRRRRA